MKYLLRLLQHKEWKFHSPLPPLSTIRHFFNFVKTLATSSKKTYESQSNSLHVKLLMMYHCKLILRVEETWSITASLSLMEKNTFTDFDKCWDVDWACLNLMKRHELFKMAWITLIERMYGNTYNKTKS